MFDSYESFSRVMDRCCENYGVLVLDNTAPTSRVEDCLFWYRADTNLPPFTMGSSSFRRLASKHAKSDLQRRAEAAAAAASSTKDDKKITFVERLDRRGRPLPEDRNVVLA